MALSKQQQAQLAALEAQRDEPVKRTTHGLAGILHHLLDVTSGRVAHVSPEVVDDLHGQAEDLAGAGQDQAAGHEDQAADDPAGEQPAE